MNTIWNLKDKVSEVNSEPQSIALNNLVKNISEMYENLRFNTAVSEIMIFVNNVKDDEKISKQVYLDFLKCLAPLAPFISEELFQVVNKTQFSKDNSIHLKDFPKYKPELGNVSEINLPIQINGKLISVIKVKPEIKENEALIIAKNNEKVSKILGSKEIKKIVFVSGKILSLII